MTTNRIVSREDWVAAQRAHMTKEKAFTRERDALSAARRALPWCRVETPYVFEGPNGRVTLADLFDGRHQLVVYHFMFGPDWPQGCPSCSFLADHFDGMTIHLAHRDTTLTAVSRAPYAQLAPFKARMGWRFPWVSSDGTRFNFDYHVSCTPEDLAAGTVYYNHERGPIMTEEMPGVSVFYRDERGDIFHTYSTYARGGDMLIGVYNFLDLTPKGRDEDGLQPPMAWLRHHDRYDDPTSVWEIPEAVDSRAMSAGPCCASEHERG